MPNFQYRASDRAGKTSSGVVEASNLGDALRKLRRDGNYVLSIEAATEAKGDDDTPLIPRRITRHEIIGFTNELSVMVDTGITLSVAIGHSIEQAENPSLLRVLRNLKAAVESGEDFSAALARHPKLFDKTYVQLVKASEASGSLGTMLQRIVDHTRRQMDLQGKVRAALAYPVFLMFAAVAASIFLLVYVFPKFTPIFKGRGITLPLPTRVMIATSTFLTDCWYLLGIALVALALGLVWFCKTAAGRRMADKTKLHIPILGEMLKKAAISRSIRTLSTMLASGVPMLQAIRLCGEVSGNVFYEEDWNVVANGVTEGQQIHELLARSPRFPKSLSQMIAAGEQTGRLSTILDRLSDFYDRELENAIKTATSMIEPVMVCVMGLLVGSVAMALLLPIFTLSRNVN